MNKKTWYKKTTWQHVGLLVFGSVTVLSILAILERLNQPSHTMPVIGSKFILQTAQNKISLTPLHQRKLQEQLHFWRDRHYQFPTTPDDQYGLAHFRIQNQQVELLNRDKPDVQKDIPRLQIVWNMLKSLARHELSAQDHGDLFFVSKDSYPPDMPQITFPYLVWNSHQSQYAQGQLIFPDPYWLRDMLALKPKPLETGSWRQKRNQVLFVGVSSTNENRRVASQRYQHHPQMKIVLQSNALLSRQMSWAEQRKYRYLLYLDGYGASWNRMDMQLRSQSVVLAQTEFVLFTAYGLEPHVHFVPCDVKAEAPHDIPSQIQNLEKQPSRIDAMIQAAHKYVNTHNTYAQTWLYMTHMVKAALAMFRQAQK